MSEIIRSNLRKLRTVKGLSQSAFGETFSINRSNIAAYEEGRAKPKIELLTEIADHYGINLELLLKKELSVNQILGFKNNTVKGADKPQETHLQPEQAELLKGIESVEKELKNLKRLINQLNNLK